MEDDNYVDTTLPDPNVETFIVYTSTHIDLHGMNNSTDNTAGPSLAEVSSSRPTRFIKQLIWMQDYLNPSKSQKYKHPLASNLS